MITFGYMQIFPAILKYFNNIEDVGLELEYIEIKLYLSYFYYF